MENYTIDFTQEELDLLRSRIKVCGCLEKLADAKPGKFVLTEIELEELLDAIADELENSDDDETDLDTLCEKLETLVD
jgi:hypothetical protein